MIRHAHRTAHQGQSALAIAGAGGLLFVGSLVYFVYFYLIALGRPAAALGGPGDVVRPLLVNAGLFGIFALHHSIMARANTKHFIARVVPPSLERSIYVWVASLLFFAACYLWQPIPGVIYRLPGGVDLLGYGVQLLGLWIVFRATRSLDSLELAGVRQVLEAKRDQKGVRPLFPGRRREKGAVPLFGPTPLQIAGPFRLVRHPVYLGWVLFVFGAPHITANRLAFAAISTAYLIIAIPFEERSLRSAYGSQYDAYAARVRWRLIPGIY